MERVRRATVQEKLQFLLEKVERLQSFLPPHHAQYRVDAMAQAAVERCCQLLIECAMDVNSEILKDVEKSAATSGRDGFARVRRLDIISERIYNRFCDKHIRFRNLLVHAYDKIDTRTAYYTARSLVSDAVRYAKAIRLYLDSAEQAEAPHQPERESTQPSSRGRQ